MFTMVQRDVERGQLFARDLGLVEFPKTLEVAGHGRAVQQVLKRIEKDRDQYLLVGTGHGARTKPGTGVVLL